MSKVVDYFVDQVDYVLNTCKENAIRRQKQYEEDIEQCYELVSQLCSTNPNLVVDKDMTASVRVFLKHKLDNGENSSFFVASLDRNSDRTWSISRLGFLGERNVNYCVNYRFLWVESFSMKRAVKILESLLKNPNVIKRVASDIRVKNYEIECKAERDKCKF